MQFMIIRKSDASTEAGAVPGEAILSAGGGRGAVKLSPSSKGARVIFSKGKARVVEGPFTGPSGLVAALTMVEAGSKEEAIEMVKRGHAMSGGGEVEFEVREAGCPGGVAGVRPEGAPGGSDAGTEGLSRYAVLFKMTEHTEAGFVADEAVLAAMTRRNEEAVRAGVLVAGEGLKPSARGARVKLSNGKPRVVDGPFAEAKELIAGYWLIQAKSRAEAIEWVKQYPFPLEPDGEGEVEVREAL